jgi:hypothetical protein
MEQQLPSAVEIEGWLNALGAESLCQWDVLVFLHGHRASLLGADHLARLLGYATEPVIAALDTLESRGLVERSRVSGGARLYQFTTPPDGRRGEAFERLLLLAGRRDGRLLLSAQLRRGDPNPSPAREAARRFPEHPQQASRAAQQRPPERDERSPTWLKAI